MTDPFVPKGEPRPGPEQTCGYKTQGMASECGLPATWHVMWDRAFDNSLACDEHMALVQSRWVYDDRHPVVADCTMPGALWDYREKRCVFPTEESVTAVAEIVEVTA